MNRIHKNLHVAMVSIIAVVIVIDFLAIWIETTSCIGLSIINIVILLCTLIYSYIDSKAHQKLVWDSNTLTGELKDKVQLIKQKDEMIQAYDFKIQQLHEEIDKYIKEVNALAIENSRLKVENHELKDSLDNALEKKYRQVLEFLSNTWHDADSFEESDKVFIKKQVERLMRSLNYSFVDYSDDTQSFYQTELSDEKEVITTKRAIKNTSTNKVAIKGIAYIPTVS